MSAIHYLSGFLVVNTDQIRFYPEPSDHIFNEILPKPTYLFSGNCTNEYDDVTLFSDAAKTAIKKALDTGSKVISTCFIFKNLGPIFIGPAPCHFVMNVLFIPHFRLSDFGILAL